VEFDPSVHSRLSTTSRAHAKDCSSERVILAELNRERAVTVRHTTLKRLLLSNPKTSLYCLGLFLSKVTQFPTATLSLFRGDFIGQSFELSTEGTEVVGGSHTEIIPEKS
jgi:hypothetical protein